MALQLAPEDPRRDRDIVVAAVNQDWLVLDFVLEDIWRYRDIVMAAVAQNG